MVKRPPSPRDVHPALWLAIERTAETYAMAHDGMCVALITAHRTVESQRAAYERGQSKLDGTRRPGRHNYLPALAVDLWPCRLRPGQPHPADYIFVGRPERGVADIVLSAKLGLTAGLDLDGDGDSDAHDVWEAYKRLARVAVNTPVRLPVAAGRDKPSWTNTLTWGGTWRASVSDPPGRRTKFRDGPHFQLDKRDTHYCVQHALLLRGFDPGPLDGAWGRRSRAALREAQRASGLPRTEGNETRTAAPKIRPALWRWLHGSPK